MEQEYCNDRMASLFMKPRTHAPNDKHHEGWIHSLGNMAAGIVVNLVKAYNEVIVWNRSAAKAALLVEAGAALAARPKEAARGREATFHAGRG